MKKHIVIAAVALGFCAPLAAHAESTVQRTQTAVEQAALAMGWEAPPAPVPPPALADPSIAPAVPAAVPAAAAPSGKFSDGWQPKTVNGLPAGLVMNGPKNEEEYKRLHHPKPKKKAPVKKKAEGKPAETPAAADMSAPPAVAVPVPGMEAAPALAIPPAPPSALPPVPVAPPAQTNGQETPPANLAPVPPAQPAP